MNPEENKAFTRLVTANGLAEADVWKAVLEASGIQVFLRHEAMAAVIPETAGEIAAGDLWGPESKPRGAFRSSPASAGGPPTRAKPPEPPHPRPGRRRDRAWRARGRGAG